MNPDPYRDTDPKPRPGDGDDRGPDEATTSDDFKAKLRSITFLPRGRS